MIALRVDVLPTVRSGHHWQTRHSSKRQKTAKLLYDEGTLRESIASEADSDSMAVGVNAYSEDGYLTRQVLKMERPRHVGSCRLIRMGSWTER